MHPRTRSFNLAQGFAAEFACRLLLSLRADVSDGAIDGDARRLIAISDRKESADLLAYILRCMFSKNWRADCFQFSVRKRSNACIEIQLHGWRLH